MPNPRQIFKVTSNVMGVEVFLTFSFLIQLQAATFVHTFSYLSHSSSSKMVYFQALGHQTVSQQNSNNVSYLILVTCSPETSGNNYFMIV